jgi:nucleoside-diphosphate-sugar epimerase
VNFSNKKISILGCGWLGLPLARAFVATGASVKGSVRHADKLNLLEQYGLEPFVVDLCGIATIDLRFFDCDVLFLAFPPQSKDEATLNYLQKVSLVCELARGRSSHIVLFSSTSVFANSQVEVDELTVPIPDTEAGRIIREAELYLINDRPAQSSIIRLGGLIGPGRNLVKHFAGRSEIEGGENPINLISLRDAVAFCFTWFNKEQPTGVLHAVHPHHPSRSAFYTQLCKHSGMSLPNFVVNQTSNKTVFGLQSSEKLAFQYTFEDWFLGMDKVILTKPKSTC